jgi:tetratricopeptide (TPR) repeat protein
VADDDRLSDLERRVASDPASIAFAQLAEDYRRAGRLDDAIRVCRAGLALHPSHPSARVTLGRALLAQGLHDAAGTEFESAAREAPDHFVVRRGLDEWRRATGQPLPAADDSGLGELERWLEAIQVDRAIRAGDRRSDATS